MEYYSLIKKNNATCSNMDEPRNYLTKQSKSERERQTPYHLNMTQTNISMNQKQTHRQRAQTCGCQGGWVGKRSIGSLGLADANDCV